MRDEGPFPLPFSCWDPWCKGYWPRGSEGLGAGSYTTSGFLKACGWPLPRETGAPGEEGSLLGSA